jgi:glycerol-1-phosphate dehydrogenase [NAD(P)+]
MEVNGYVRPWHFSTIRDYHIGFGALTSVSKVCSAYKWKDLALITGNKTYEVAGKQLEELLRSSKFEVQVIKSKAIGSISLQDVNDVCSQIERADSIIGVGGGSKLDIAKLVAQKYECHMVSVPTSIANDGLASNIASVVDENGIRQSIQTIMPIALVADTKLIQISDPRLSKAGVGEAVSNYTAIEDWRLASKKENVYKTKFSKHAYLAASAAVQYLVRKIGELPEIKINDILDTIIINHVASGALMSVIGSSQPCSGAEHKLSHILDRDYKTGMLHGEQVGIGAIVTSYLQSEKHRWKHLKRSFMFDINWKTIRDALKKIGAPSTADDLDLTPEKLTEALIKARDFRPERYTILNEVKDSEIKHAVDKTVA